jgi:hypothetical protein
VGEEPNHTTVRNPCTLYHSILSGENQRSLFYRNGTKLTKLVKIVSRGHPSLVSLVKSEIIGLEQRLSLQKSTFQGLDLWLSEDKARPWIYFHDSKFCFSKTLVKNLKGLFWRICFIKF